jgi:hypothetical protein
MKRPRWMMRHYVLDGEHRPVEEPDLLTFARWFENDVNRRVGYTQITSEVSVSTVFVAFDHRYFGKGPPLLFETMVFGGERDGEQQRYSSWDDAATGHAALVRALRKIKAKAMQ